uniref:Uncharacterized protein n=1 Tax=Lotharella globosa TaxID=91324 RepID=A0A7S4E138_9EUKA|mmetsp:Transcript_9201/g.18013  ORF Transcript_9201/g.18013 Transcript_9201/m.18013 type:complete len:193 (-) Transcript_9201:87-665(-)
MESSIALFEMFNVMEICRLKDEMLEFSMRKIEELQSMVSIKDRIISELMKEIDTLHRGEINTGKKSMPAIERQATADVKQIGVEDDVAQIPGFSMVHRVAKVEMTLAGAIPEAQTGSGGYEAAKKSDVDPLRSVDFYAGDADTKTRKTTTPTNLLSPADPSSPQALEDEVLDSETVEDLDVNASTVDSRKEI